MERRRQTKFAEQLAFWFNEALLPEFASRVLPFDIPIALLCGGLPTPDMRFDEDTMIAATAICHELPIVTRNVSHFKRLDVSIINPWDD
ncbi:hypothetical protein GCM10011390_40140 [Aureimonas endophytica]|uniref:PIN domain-containing protein n=2 Tax=Aureimonas endophytica TaxID=2027858 RepID=A0A916ZXF8_9HYPH|nr:hypothetical protein GCM10011390_40140 [Aureimonas endophytica]